MQSVMFIYPCLQLQREGDQIALARNSSTNICTDFQWLLYGCRIRDVSGCEEAGTLFNVF